VKVRLADGKVERRIALRPAGNRFLGDLLVAGDGSVFVTDSRNPVLFWIEPGSDEPVEITSPLLRSPQGMALAPDRKTLFVADYSHGLLAVDLEPQAVRWVAAPPGFTTHGLYGIGWPAGASIGIQTNVEPALVVRFQLRRDGRTVNSPTVIDRNFEIADEPTNFTIAGGELLYIANSQFGKY